MGKIAENLFEIGFNKLEADVYIYLLSHSPATAYKIGKQINKPTANVYKAIDALAKKGAVIIEKNKNKLCFPVNPDEFFSHYERNIYEKTKKAREALKELHKIHDEEKSYSIDSVSLVFERFRMMMQKCKSIAVIDAFPKALAKVKDVIEETAKNGIAIHIEAYQPIAIKGANVTCASIGKEAVDYWKSQQLNVVIDGEEHLIALMDNELKTVKHASWSNNTYISCILHAGRLHEQTVMKIMKVKDQPNFKELVNEILGQQKFFFNTNIPGFNKLFLK